MYTHKKSIRIHKIYTSPKHNYFTRDKFDIGNAPSIEHERVELRAKQGLPEDRFEFSTYPITLFSLEVAEEVCRTLELALQLELFRRNMIVSGVHLNSLIGEEFILSGVKFRGLGHCSPCPWMNAVMKKGAYTLMKGRGGLRVEVLSGGSLLCGETILESQVLQNESPLTPLKRGIIPS